jgi:hypothetical protein
MQLISSDPECATDQCLKRSLAKYIPSDVLFFSSDLYNVSALDALTGYGYPLSINNTDDVVFSQDAVAIGSFKIYFEPCVLSISAILVDVALADRIQVNTTDAARYCGSNGTTMNPCEAMFAYVGCLPRGKRCKLRFIGDYTINSC